jgi:AcrR family transcriptional regulator
MRERVLQAAMDMLANDGVAEFTTRRLARHAGTSTPAVYELFGDKAGLVREVFFESFRLLRQYLGEVRPSPDPRGELISVIESLRMFAREHPALTDLMFSRPFADFDPGPAERRAGDEVRLFIVAVVRRCMHAGVLEGDEVDIAHVLVAMAQGLAAQETAGWLGTSQESRDRRWDLAVTALLDGLRPASGGEPACSS